jgi:hypothetical protein
LPVIVLITGAEELGLLGALAYVRDAGRESLLGRQVLNFDGIGTSGKLAVVGRSRGPLGRRVNDAGRELHILRGGLPPIGAQFDHLPFADLGLEPLKLVTTGAATLSVHTPEDDVSKPEMDGCRRTGEVALRVLDKLGVELERSPGGRVE